MSICLESYFPSADDPGELRKVRELLDEARGPKTIPEDPEKILDELRIYEEWAGGERGSFLVARDDNNNITALAHATLLDEKVAVNALTVEPNVRGHGLGKQVIEAVINLAAGEGKQAVSAYVHQENQPALNMLESTGFEPLPNDHDLQDPDSKYLAVQRTIAC